MCSKQVEKEKRELARQYGMVRSEVSGGEIAEELEKERRSFQLSMCEVSGSTFTCISSASFLPNKWTFPCVSFPLSQYLIKVNEIKTKRGVDLLQNLIKHYHSHNK